MNDEKQSSQSLTSDQLGGVFRKLADEYATEGARANEETWAKICDRGVGGGAERLAPPTGVWGRRPVVWGLAAAVACGLAVIGVRSGAFGGGADEAFFYAVDGARASFAGVDQEEGELIASGDKPLLVEFSDETQVKLEPFSTLRVSSSAKVKEVTARLSQGRAQFQAGYESSAKFTLQAGVYTLRPVGATFSFGYLPKEGQLDVKSKAGIVLVTDESGKQYRVEGGGTLRLPEGAVRVETVKEASGESADSSGGVKPSGASPSTETLPSGIPSTATPAAGTTPLSFKQLAAEGKFAEVVAEAKRQGLSRVLATGSASELQELGQAARYTGDLALAAQTWNQMTSRFSGPSAQNARFFLGRLAEQRGDLGQALMSYDAYLKSGTGGVYTAEALGRKLSIVSKSYGAEKARPIAEEYLRRFPKGPYAKTARELAGGE
jgi:ferric-dicitrate binding protein FerR (iron transport regulator)